MPRTYATKPTPAVKYWKRTGQRPRRVNIKEAVARRATYLLKELPPTAPGRVLLGDSRLIASFGVEERFDAVVTSPPYLGMRSYRPDQWLRHWFLGGPELVDYDLAGMLPPLVDFATELRRVWLGAAALCRPGAALTVRFGALPSVKANAEQALRSSLEETAWEILDVTSAGSASVGKRQAKHMNQTGDAAEEIDLRARLAA